jgi:hypothetical protein
LDRQEPHLTPILNLTSAVGDLRHRLADGPPERFQAGRTYPLVAAFWEHVADLPVVAAVNEDDEPAPTNVAGGILGVACSAREPKPEHVYGRGGTDYL